MMEFVKEREEVAYFMRRLYEQKLTTTSGGNVSLRVENKVLITPSQIDKARIKANQIGVLTVEGENLTPELKTSMETKMHLAIYRKRSDVVSIVHAHPVFATSFAISKSKIRTDLAGEARLVVGTPSIAPYALMGTNQLASIVAENCINANVVLMENHGVLAVGDNLLMAFDRLEVLEASAKMTLITELLGKRKELSKDHLNEIDNLFS